MLAAAEDIARERARTRLAISVGIDNLDAARLYRRLNYQPTGVRDTYSYTWFDVDGAQHHATETSELLVKELRP